jgi:iron complex transport system substrate-binding protein
MAFSRRAALAAIVVTAVALGCSHDKPVPPVVAKRVVSLGPAMTESLFAVGAGAQVVARSRFCDFPPEALRLPAVGGIDVDVESILELKPDLVVGPPGAWSTRITETMAAHHVATLFPDEIHDLDGVDAMILTLGHRTGHADEARRVVIALDTQERAIEKAVEPLPKPRVLFLVGVSPVVAAGPGSFANELLADAGGANVVLDGGAWPKLGFERVVELDPDVVVDASGTDSGGPHVTADAPGWSGLRAVREGHVVPMTDERVLRSGPRIGEGLAVLARALHPGAVP